MKCNFCDKDAIVDGKTKMGPWAFMCAKCYDNIGYKVQGLFSILDEANKLEEEKEFTCCLCGIKERGYGNNPYPLNPDPNARCCDVCNDLVIAKRIELALAGKKKMKKEKRQSD